MHRPGPWVAKAGDVRVDRLAKPIFPEGLWHIWQSGVAFKLPVCSVDVADDYDEQTRLNAEDTARLIAAAPELLDACLFVKDFLASLEDSSGDEGDPLKALRQKFHRPLHLKLDAAIAKVGGK